MTSFTPGPWIAAASPSSVVGWPVVARPMGRSICNVSWLPGLPDDATAECAANARLIAAAPALLEALQRLAGMLSGDGMSAQDRCDAYEIADAAIAKATGAPQ